MRAGLVTPLTGPTLAVSGTDLGIPCLHDDGRLFFFFGDSGKHHDKPVAWTRATDPFGDAGVPLHPCAPLRIDGLPLGNFEVPTGAFFRGGRFHVFVMHGKEPGEPPHLARSYLASGDDPEAPFTIERLVCERGKFIQCAPLLVDEDLYVFGTGDYRRSHVYLTRNAEYWTGTGWSADEAEAAPIFEDGFAGELSVARIGDAFVLLYNRPRDPTASRWPQQILLRTAAAPWGPWSEPRVAFDADRDRAWGTILHMPGKDTLHLKEPEQKDAMPGDPYGPYVISPWSTRERVVLTMSTNVPYQVVLVATELA